MNFGPQMPKNKTGVCTTPRFWQLRDLMENIFRMQHDIDDQVTAYETTMGLLHVQGPKFYELWPANSQT